MSLRKFLFQLDAFVCPISGHSIPGQSQLFTKKNSLFDKFLPTVTHALISQVIKKFTIFTFH